MTLLHSSRLRPLRLYPRSTANGMIGSWMICASWWLTGQRTNHLISFRSTSHSAVPRQRVTSQSRFSVLSARCQRSLPLPAFIRSSLFLSPAAMAEQQQFYLLLSNLMSPDNTVRKQSEVWESGRDRFVWMFNAKSNILISCLARSFSAGRSASLWPSTCVERALLLCGFESFQRVDSGNKFLPSFESACRVVRRMTL